MRPFKASPCPEGRDSEGKRLPPLVDLRQEGVALLGRQCALVGAILQRPPQVLGCPQGPAAMDDGSVQNARRLTQAVRLLEFAPEGYGVTGHDVDPLAHVLQVRGMVRVRVGSLARADE